MTASGGKLSGWRTELKGKRTHGDRQQGGESWGEGCIRELNGNGNNTIKIKEINK